MREIRGRKSEVSEEAEQMADREWFVAKIHTSENRRNTMNRSIMLLALFSLLLAPCFPVEAQQPTKMPRIAFLGGATAPALSKRLESFRQGLRELGYFEGKNIVIDYRYGEGNQERLPGFASELVSSKIDVIITGGPLSTRAAREATTKIPIVMAFDNDPVGNGLVASLARPGGNITGLSTLYPEISGKQLDLLKEIFPRLSRVAVLGNLNEPGNEQALKETERAASAFRAQLQYLDVNSSEHIETAFQAASKARVDAALVLAGAVFFSHRVRVADLAIKSRVPAVYQASEYVDAGGLMTYGVNINDLFRRAATYVDKILKGAKSADLPVEQPIKFEFVINLKTAKQIGLTIPPNVLARADRVIR
jgi:putative tryptophan/tyrosine transport system substrate-binding protein